MPSITKIPLLSKIKTQLLSNKLKKITSNTPTPPAPADKINPRLDYNFYFISTINTYYEKRDIA